MGRTLRELIKNAEFEVDEDKGEELKTASKSRRGKDGIKRPNAEVSLKSLADECFTVVKTQKDPTSDLEFLPRVWAKNHKPIVSEKTHGYIIQDKDTKEVFYAPTKLCLDANFIYRDDVEIFEVSKAETSTMIFDKLMADVNIGCIPNKQKYILDDPGSETYELYTDSNYPSLKYGKATPTGMFIHVYPNRFHRDMAILELDELYSTSSRKHASKLTSKKLKPNEAIIISDGAWLKDTCSSCYFYLDNTTVLKHVEGAMPTELDQAVLIAEINGAYNALVQCYAKKKTSIKYYYDNTSILNVFKNRKTEYIKEVKEYKEFLVKMNREGYDIEFIELHPKTDEDKDKLNKALTYFHNTCDAECRAMAEIFKKNYKDFVVVNESTGTGFKDFYANNKAKGTARNSGHNKGNNSKSARR